MIARLHFDCLSCLKKTVARVQISGGSQQTISFECPHCATDSKFTLDLRHPPRVDVISTSLVNLKQSDTSSEDGAEIRYFSSDFIVPQEAASQDLFFPSIFEVRRVVEKVYGEENVAENISGAAGASNICDIWAELKRAVKFNKIKKIEMRNEITKNHDLLELIFNFCGIFVGRKFHDFLDEIKSDVDKARRANPSEFKRFLAEYYLERYSERVDSYLEITDSYLAGYDEFKQVMLYSRFRVDTPPFCIASSNDFPKVKMFYGDAFECLSGHLDFFACMNNILEGRDYETFKSIDLKKYLNSDKGQRDKCLRVSGNFCSIIAEYDNSLRNASHHRWLKIDTSKKSLKYINGGSGSNVVKLTYTEYLYKCNAIFINLLLAFSAELYVLYSEGVRLNEK